MKIRFILSMLAMAVLLAAGSAGAEPWHTQNELLAHAVPDECYAGVGVDYPGGITPGDGYTPPGEQCPGDIPKTNDTYVWALTEEGDSLWFASAANVMCTTAGVFMDQEAFRTYYGAEQDLVVGWDGQNPIKIPFCVCEHGDSQVARENLTSEATGDWRPSKVYRYIKNTEALINLTGQIYDAGHGSVFDDLLGIRCAGSHNGVIFFAGGNQSYTGITMFAFDDEGNYLGYNTMTNGRQIRKMIEVGNQLYTGIAGATGRGLILRWMGNRSNPFRWQTVGRVTGAVTELAEYVDNNGRTRIAANAAGGLYVSPPMIWGRLSWWQAWGWQNVWSSSEYEPDSITRLTYGPGAVAQLGEWVYWGTMHIPFHASYLNLVWRYNNTLPDDGGLNLYYGTLRATTIWRGRNIGQSGEEIQLVYGESHLGAWDSETQTFVPVETGWNPLNMAGVNHPYFGTPAGSSGFYNPYNNYSWTAQSFSDETGDHLFFGTMDQTLINNQDITNPSVVANGGADLWRFSINSSIGGSDTMAVPEFTNGAGNNFQYGVRCLIASDDGEKLYLGMANMASLLNPDSVPGMAINGGWEMRELSRVQP